MLTLHDLKYNWNFLPSAGDKVYGMNDSGWDTFAGTPFKSLAREICQNSLDARSDIDKPVTVEFHSFDLNQHNIPQIKDIQKALYRAKEFWTIQQNDFATKEFLEIAMKITESEVIHCLRISDKNTTGLVGSNERYGTPWCNLLKGQGVSDKSGTSGGSKGIGKYAPFACSAIRTVIYSTLANDGLKASQGVSRLISFLDDNNRLSMGLAYFGPDEEGCPPITDYHTLDPEFSRGENEYGTDIFIIGFTDDSDWKDKMIGSVLDGFLYAIEQESLVVKIDNVTVDKAHLKTVVDNLDRKYVPEHADEYYQVLTNKKSQAFDSYSINDRAGKKLGTVKLKALMNADYNRTCAMVRQTGMKIMDMNRISTFIYFAAVLYIEGDELNAYLRKLENAQHTEWQVERLHTKQEKKEAEALIKELKDYVKKCIRSMRSASENEPINLAIGEYLSADMPNNDKNIGQGEDINNDISSVSITTITRAGKAIKDENEGEDEDVAVKDPDGNMIPAGGQNPEHHGTGPIEPSPEPNPGEGHEGYRPHNPDDNDTGRRKIVSIPSTKTRVICRDRKAGEYTLIYKPTMSSNDAYLDVYLAAESQNYRAELISASNSGGEPLIVDNGKINGLIFNANEELRLNIKLNYADMCAMEVKGFGSKK